MSVIVDSLVARAVAADEAISASGDARIAIYPLMDSIYPQLLLCIGYVVIVYAGIALMKSRSPAEIRGLMIAYNFGMVALNAFVVSELVRFAWLSGYSFRCAAVPPGDSLPAQRVVRAAYLFWATKIVEFSDTFMFVARKKSSQITFLHVFHHFSVPIAVWFTVKVAPGGHGAFFATLNSLVHVVMYTYYGIAALGPAYSAYLWWKPWMTRAQLLQFVAIWLHSGQLFFDNSCGFPIVIATAINVFSVIFFVLFMQYYLKAFLSGRKPGGRVANAANGDAGKSAANGVAANGVAANGDVGKTKEQ